MNKKTTASLSRIILTSFVMLLSMAAMSSATDIIWDNGDGDYDWTNPLNWIGHAVPGTGTDQYARIRTTAGPVFSGQTATVYRVYLEGAGNGTLTMNSGTLNTVSHIYVADVNTAKGTLNMNGGAINIATTFFVARDACSVTDVNLSGGTITCALLSLNLNNGTGGRINIKGGTLIFTTSSLPVSTFIANGWIKAYDGAGTVVVDTTTIPGKTIVTALLSLKALIPNPTSGVTNVAVSGTNLTWRPGFAATSHDVYFGTDSNDVNNSNRLLGDLDGDGIVDLNDISLLAEYWLDDPAGSDPYAGVNDDNIVNFYDYALFSQDWMDDANQVFKGNQDANSFSPGTLAFGTKYYWRIDEVSGPNTTKGDIWNFTTQTGKASNVLPINGDLGVLSRAVLAWTAAPGAVSHDVYFGTTNPPETLVSDNQTATIYNPGGIANSTTYYWRIDENYGTTTMQGDVWSFRTVDVADEPDLVFVQAADPQMGWSNCGGTTDYLWGTTVGKINLLNPDFILVAGDLVDSSTSAPQVTTYKNYRSGLTPTIECFEVPGNHDISEPPSQARYDAWATNYGYGSFPNPVPWYSFAYGDSFFIGLDDIVLRSPFGGKDVEEMAWLETTLHDANEAGYAHKFVFMHVALFITSAGEPNNAAENLPLVIRGQLLSLFHEYGVKVVMAGHRHTNNYAVDGDLQMYTTTSCTCGLGSPPTPPGIRIFKVYSDRVEQELRTLDSLPVGSANIKKGPYLIYPGVNTQMTVLWQLDASTSASSIAWGTDTTYSTGYANTTESGNGTEEHQHKYNITGLTPGTKYYYRVTISGVPKTGNFYAAPAEDATDLKFFMYGDTRTNGNSNNSLCAQMISTYTADAAYQTMVLHAGDWVESDAEAYWTGQWYNYTWTSLMTAPANMPFMGCIGNHEGGAPTIFKKYRPFPFVAATYFSYDYGPVHVAVVDQHSAGGYAVGSTQYTWLHADLAASTKPWKIIVLHMPGWQAAGGHSNDTIVQSDIQPLCVDHGVAIVLGGHVHYYSRASVPFSSSEYPPWGYVQHVTNGGGGAPLYTPVAGQPNVVTYSKSLAVSKVAISGNTLTCITVDQNGSVLDTFTLIKP